jgi:hypothetical protein
VLTRIFSESGDACDAFIHGVVTQWLAGLDASGGAAEN